MVGSIVLSACIGNALGRGEVEKDRENRMIIALMTKTKETEMSGVWIESFPYFGRPAIRVEGEVG